MTYNFDNIAIKCDTWQQMQQLKEIAERQGYKNMAMCETQFNTGYVYFVIIPDFNAYTNMDTVISTETEISFTTFITSHPDYHADGC